MQNNGRIPLILAPMAGVTDHAFRLICAEYGADFCVTEMISAKAVQFNDRKTESLARIEADEAPCALQLFGSDPEIMADSASRLIDAARTDHNANVPVAVDINMGCPVKKVVNNGEGSALMRTPERVGEIVRAVSDRLDLPVSVKIRAGWDKENKNAVEVATVAEANGAACVTVHGRTRAQMYMPGADYGIIAQVRRALSVPVVGNGDVFSPEDAMRLLSQTDCDGIMVARGALGNPFLFAQIRAALEGKPYQKPDPLEVIATAMRHLDLLTREKGESAVLEFRKHAGWYTKGMRGASAVRGRMNAARTTEEMSELFAELIRQN